MDLQYLHQRRGDFWMWWITTSLVVILAVSFAVGMGINIHSHNYWFAALFTFGFVLVAIYFFKSWIQTADFIEEVPQVVGINWQLWPTGTHYAPWGLVRVPESFFADLRPFAITAFKEPQLIEAKGGRIILGSCEITLQVTDTLKALFSMGGKGPLTGAQYLQQVYFPLLYEDVVDSIIGQMEIVPALDLTGHDIQSEVNDRVRSTCAEHGYAPMDFLLGNPDEGPDTKAVKTKELNENMWWTLFRRRLMERAGVPQDVDLKLLLAPLDDDNPSTWTTGNRYFKLMEKRFEEVLTAMLKIYTVSAVAGMDNLSFLGAMPALLGGMLGGTAASGGGRRGRGGGRTTP